MAVTAFLLSFTVLAYTHTDALCTGVRNLNHVKIANTVPIAPRKAGLAGYAANEGLGR